MGRGKACTAKLRSWGMSRFAGRSLRLPLIPVTQDGCHIPVSMLHVAQGGRHAVTPSYRVTHGYCYNFYRKHGIFNGSHDTDHLH